MTDEEQQRRTAAAQDVLDILHVTHDDADHKRFDLKLQVVHWGASQLPTEQLCAEFVRRWLSLTQHNHSESYQGVWVDGDHHQTLANIIIDLSAGTGGESRRQLPPLRSVERIDVEVWRDFCDAYETWAARLKMQTAASDRILP